MKKKSRVLASVLLVCLLMCQNSITVQAEGREKTVQQEIDSRLLPNGVKESKNQKVVMRGKYIATSGLSITNYGYGVLEVYIDTLAHVAVKKIKMTVYLDQWNEALEDWIQVDSKSLTYEYKEGGEILNEASQSFLVENLETDKYYRLRGLHAVWSFDGYMETQSTMTDGILLTDGPA